MRRLPRLHHLFHLESPLIDQVFLFDRRWEVVRHGLRRLLSIRASDGGPNGTVIHVPSEYVVHVESFGTKVLLHGWQFFSADMMGQSLFYCRTVRQDELVAIIAGSLVAMVNLFVSDCVTLHW